MCAKYVACVMIWKILTFICSAINTLKPSDTYMAGQNDGNIFGVFSAGRCENNDLRLYGMIDIWTAQIFFQFSQDNISNK